MTFNHISNSLILSEFFNFLAVSLIEQRLNRSENFISNLAVIEFGQLYLLYSMLTLRTLVLVITKSIQG